MCIVWCVVYVKCQFLWTNTMCDVVETACTSIEHISWHRRTNSNTLWFYEQFCYCQAYSLKVGVFLCHDCSTANLLYISVFKQQFLSYCLACNYSDIGYFCLAFMWLQIHVVCVVWVHANIRDQCASVFVCVTVLRKSCGLFGECNSLYLSSLELYQYLCTYWYTTWTYHCSISA